MLIAGKEGGVWLSLSSPPLLSRPAPATTFSLSPTPSFCLRQVGMKGLQALVGLVGLPTERHALATPSARPTFWRDLLA